VRGHPHCGGYAGVTGRVMHANGAAFPGIAVGVWSDGWEGLVFVSEADGKYEVNLSSQPPGHFKVAVVKLDTCTKSGDVTTAVNCQVRSNIITGVTVTEDCNVNRVTEIDFIGP
jgi:hypothetical protein